MNLGATNGPPGPDRTGLDEHGGRRIGRLASLTKSIGGWFSAKYHEIFLEIDDNTRFPETEAELSAQLQTRDAVLAADILAEAEASYARLQDRVDSAERRAATLQGGAAIASGLTLTAAGLLVDSTKLHGWVWQVLFGLAIVFIAFALAMSTWRATLASSRVHSWMTPSDRDVLRRPGQTVAAARIERAASLLASIGANQRFARYKVAMMRASTEWILRALVGLMCLAIPRRRLRPFRCRDDARSGFGIGTQRRRNSDARRIANAQPVNDADGHRDFNADSKRNFATAAFCNAKAEVGPRRRLHHEPGVHGSLLKRRDRISATGRPSDNRPSPRPNPHSDRGSSRLSVGDRRFELCRPNEAKSSARPRSLLLR